MSAITPVQVQRTSPTLDINSPPVGHSDIDTSNVISFQLGANYTDSGSIQTLVNKRMQQLKVAAAVFRRKHHMAIQEQRILRAAVLQAKDTGNYDTMVHYLFLATPAKNTRATAWLVNRLKKINAGEHHQRSAEPIEATNNEEAPLKSSDAPEALVASQTPLPKKRGRPSNAERAIRLAQQPIVGLSSPNEISQMSGPGTSIKRGRPAKIQKVASDLKPLAKRRGRPSKAMMMARSV